MQLIERTVCADSDVTAGVVRCAAAQRPDGVLKIGLRSPRCPVPLQNIAKVWDFGMNGPPLQPCNRWIGVSPAQVASGGSSGSDSRDGAVRNAGDSSLGVDGEPRDLGGRAVGAGDDAAVGEFGIVNGVVGQVDGEDGAVRYLGGSDGAGCKLRRGNGEVGDHAVGDSSGGYGKGRAGQGQSGSGGVLGVVVDSVGESGRDSDQTGPRGVEGIDRVGGSGEADAGRERLVGARAGSRSDGDIEESVGSGPDIAEVEASAEESVLDHEVVDEPVGADLGAARSGRPELESEVVFGGGRPSVLSQTALERKGLSAGKADEADGEQSGKKP